MKNPSTTNEIALTSTREDLKVQRKGGRTKKYGVPNAPPLLVPIGHSLAPTSIDGRMGGNLSLAGQGVTPW